jgi:hypothetical protein
MNISNVANQARWREKRSLSCMRRSTLHDTAHFIGTYSQYLMDPSQEHVATLLGSTGCHKHPIVTWS